jgi:hypothetical protein
VNSKSLQEITAALLSISFLWIFAACVLFCSDFGCADEPSGGEIFSVSVNKTHSTNCPVTQTSKATTTERIVFKAFVLTVSTSKQSFVPKQKDHLLKIDPPHKVLIFASPPSKLLPVLRI